MSLLGLNYGVEAAPPDGCGMIRFMKSSKSGTVNAVESVQRSMRSRSFDRGIILVDRDRSQASEHGVKAFKDLYLHHMTGPDS